MEISTFGALLLFAFTTAVVHTVAGPDHYLPFIMIAKAQKQSLPKAIGLTIICGLGHVGSALLIALLFSAGIDWLTGGLREQVEEVQSSVAAYALIGFGLAYLAWALRHRWLNKHQATIEKNSPVMRQGITPWVLFIIFVLGPCEALWPVLMAGKGLGMAALIPATILFSVATIATMLVMVTVGVFGLQKIKFNFLENYAHELAGGFMAACGVAMICGL